MPYKIIISDLDGTLLNSEHQISEYSQEAINKTTEKGTKFCIATGRHHLDAITYCNNLNEKIYLITSNGARIHNPSGKLIYKQNMDMEVIMEILNSQILDNGVHISFYHEDGWILFKENPDLESTVINNGVYPVVIDQIDLKDYEIIKIIFSSKNNNALEKIEEFVAEKFSDRVEFYFSGSDTFEVNAFTVSKGNAMEILLDKESIKLSETIAFGDSLNDLDMLKKAGKSLIMEGAHIRLKELLPCNEIIGKCDDDSVAKYINMMGV
ncbi:MAG: Cof-type HAD-IIB family hydrolase [Spirochaetaceae bacterium]